jgi:hypothetical protein
LAVNYAFLGPESRQAAEASECAAEQGAFWPYHDRLYERQAGENRGAFSQDNLKRFAVELGLNGQAFDACLAYTESKVKPTGLKHEGMWISPWYKFRVSMLPPSARTRQPGNPWG